MDDKKQEDVRLSDLFSHIRPFFRFLFGKWLLLLLAICIGGALGWIYYKVQKANFKASCTFVLEEKQAGLGGLGGIASQFGFDLGSMSGGGSIFSGENIFEILKSRKIVHEVLLSKIDSTTGNRRLADLYLEFSDLRSKWKNYPALTAVSYEMIKPQLTPVQDTVLNIIYDKLVEENLIVDRAGKKGNLIKAEVESENRMFAILMSQRIVEEAKELYIFIKVGNAQLNINRLQRKADSLQALLNGKTYVAAQTQMIDANPGLASLRVPAEIAGRDKTVIATLYGEVVKNLEASKMILAQQTPVIQVIDYPNYSTKDNLISLKKLLAIGIISMLFLVFFSTLVQYIVNKNSNL